MSLAKDLVAALAPAVPLGLSHSLAGSPLILPYYHMVSDETLPHVAPLYRYRTVREFTSDVDFFLEHFKPVGLADIVAHFKHGKALPDDAFFLTFDDGFREMYDIVAPILKTKGVSAAFFINSAFVDNRDLCMHQKIALLISKLSGGIEPVLEEKLKKLLSENGIIGESAIAMFKSVRYKKRAVLDEAAMILGLDFPEFLERQKPYLDSDQVRGLLRDGFSIGAHSIDHPFYGDLTLDEQLRQTRDSMDYICKTFGVSTRSFAFPHSDAGVSRAFFEGSFGQGTIEVSFGTGGLLRDSWDGHFQRFSMEKTGLPSNAIVSRQFARRLFRNVFGGGTVFHPN